MKIIVLIFPFFLFAQKSISVDFNIRDKIILTEEGYVAKDTLSILKAKVSLKSGSFSMMLIDYNKNKKFTDYGVHYEFVSSLLKTSKKPDGILIEKINPKTKKKLIDGAINTLLPKTEFLFNGNLFVLSDLIRVSNFNYKAKITKVKGAFDYKKGYDSYYLNYSDKLSNICVRDVSNGKKNNLKKILKNKKVLIQYIYANLNINLSANFIVDSIESYEPKNIEIIYVIVDSDRDLIKKYVELKQLKFKSYYIEKSDYKSIMNTGFTFVPQSILYDKNGSILLSEKDFRIETLKNYDY